MHDKFPIIERKVPIPEAKSGGRESKSERKQRLSGYCFTTKISLWNKYAWGEMGVGDSVFFKGDIRECRKHAASAHMYGSDKRTEIDINGNRKIGVQKYQFVTRKVRDGIRIWRKS